MPVESDFGMTLSPVAAGLNFSAANKKDPLLIKDPKISYDMKTKSLREEIVATRASIKAIEINSKEFIKQMHQK